MLDYSADGLAAFTYVCIVVDIVAVILRFWSRAVSPTAQYGLDDWLALASLIPTLGVCAIALNMLKHGVGRHIHDVSPYDAMQQLKLFFAGDIVFATGVSLSRLSALACFARIFGVRSHSSRVWRFAFSTMLAVTALWPVTFILFNTFACSPVKKFWWRDAIDGHCVNQLQMLIAISASGAIVDLLILLLPLPLLLGLQMKSFKKFVVVITFSIGCSVAFMSLGRAIVSVQISDVLIADFPHAVVPELFWAVAESGDAVMAICLPAIFHLLKRGWNRGPRALVSAKETTEFGNANLRLRSVSSAASGNSVSQRECEMRPELVSLSEVELGEMPVQSCRRDVKVGARVCMTTL